MLDFKQIKELLELVADRGLDGVELERSGFRLKIDGKHTRAVTVAPAAVAAPAAGAAAPPAPPAVSGGEAAAPKPELAETVGEADSHDGDHVIESPLVGTFYRAPGPEQPTYVKVGDQISVGQVVCIVEAMKVMNEIEADVAGEIVKIFPENGQPVEFGEPLFAVRTA